MEEEQRPTQIHKGRERWSEGCRGHEHSGAKVRLRDHTSVIMGQVLIECDITIAIIAINYNVHS